MTIMMQNDLKALEARGLTRTEAIQFYAMIAQIHPTKEDEEGLDKEWEEGLPFEGGMGFTECITQLVRCILDAKDYKDTERKING